MATIANVTATGNPGFAIGPNGSTNPVLQADCSVASAATGIKVIGRAAAAGADIIVASSGTNENLKIDAKGSGTVAINTTGTGAITLGAATGVTGALTGTSTSASALAVGANGATNPVLKINANTASVATGLEVVGAAAAAGVAVKAISSGTNENLTVDAKGSGTITLGGTSTGAIALSRATTITGNTAVTGTGTITSTSASALTVGANGATNPVVQVDANTASVATGIKITGAAAAAGVALAAISSGTNENMTIDAKGSGTITLGGTSTGGITLTRAVTASSTIAGANSIKSSHATGGVGYATGAGGAVTQATSRTTGVTLNTVSGAITLVSAAGSTTPASFTVTNSAVAATDVIVLSQKSGTDKLSLDVTAVGAGSFEITFNTKSGTTTEQPVINFAVIKAVAA